MIRTFAAVVVAMRVATTAPVLLFASAIWLGPGSTASAAEQRSPLAFVTEYVRELAANENVRDAASQELSTASTPIDRLFKGIHGSTGIQIELRAQVGILKGMHLNAPFDAIIPNIIKLYQTKIAFYQELTDISTNLVSGPMSNVDYGKAIAQAPKIRAALDAIDRALFQVTPAVFATLIDKKSDQETQICSSSYHKIRT